MRHSYITQPPITQHNGIWIKYPNGQKYEKRLSFQHLLVSELLEEMSKKGFSYLQQNFSPLFDNWLPLYWDGFHQEIRYTFMLDCNQYRLADVEKQFSKVIRYDIKKAREFIQIEDSDNLEEFYKLHCSTFERQGKKGYPYELIKSIDDACKSHDARKILLGKGSDGTYYSGVYLIVDEQMVYYILSGTDSEKRNYNTLSILIYEGIKFACDTNRKFDFEGSMVMNINDYFRKFGGKLIPYYNVNRMYEQNPLWRFAIRRKQGK